MGYCRVKFRRFESNPSRANPKSAEQPKQTKQPKRPKRPKLNPLTLAALRSAYLAENTKKRIPPK